MISQFIHLALLVVPTGLLMSRAINFGAIVTQFWANEKKSLMTNEFCTWGFPCELQTMFSECFPDVRYHSFCYFLLVLTKSHLHNSSEHWTESKENKKTQNFYLHSCSGFKRFWALKEDWGKVQEKIEGVLTRFGDSNSWVEHSEYLEQYFAFGETFFWAILGTEKPVYKSYNFQTS